MGHCKLPYYTVECSMEGQIWSIFISPQAHQPSTTPPLQAFSLLPASNKYGKVSICTGGHWSLESIPTPRKGLVHRNFSRWRLIRQPPPQHLYLLSSRGWSWSLHMAPCSWCSRGMALLRWRPDATFTILGRWKTYSGPYSRRWSCESK
jgi:hypothetical protein